MILDPDEVAEVVRAAGDRRPIAIGIGTVELERAARDLEAVEPGPTFVSAADDELLGAHCRISRAQLRLDATDVHVVLLEPSTEGLLAAGLARRGEGPLVVYALPGATPEGGVPRSNVGHGPLGPARLVLGSRFGPFVLVLERQPGIDTSG